ncbi:MAG: helix-turn-helix domain-containing protein [Acidobacteriota bacterium]
MIHRRINLDLMASSGVIADLLVVIRDYLVDRRLNVVWAKKKAEVRNNSSAIFFHIHVGMPPGRYLEAARLDLAVALLTRTDMPVFEIAQRTGYGGGSTLSRALHRRFGLRPRATRTLYRNAVVEPRSPARYVTRAARGLTSIRLRQSVVEVRDATDRDVWWPLTHQLDSRQLDAIASQQHALGYATRLLRLFELGLDVRGAQALASAMLPSRTPSIGHSLQGEDPGFQFVRALDEAVSDVSGDVASVS